jgi:hypothetical protein
VVNKKVKKALGTELKVRGLKIKKFKWLVDCYGSSV